MKSFIAILIIIFVAFYFPFHPSADDSPDWIARWEFITRISRVRSKADDPKGRKQTILKRMKADDPGRKQTIYGSNQTIRGESRRSLVQSRRSFEPKQTIYGSKQTIQVKADDLEGWKQTILWAKADDPIWIITVWKQTIRWAKADDPIWIITVWKQTI